MTKKYFITPDVRNWVTTDNVNTWAETRETDLC